jgi:trk system potassium uptake protein
MNKSIYANIGFLLQTAGLLTILPIGVGLYFNETQTIISLFLAAISFFGLGFLMNALCERKNLDFKSSNILFVAAFILLPLIGAIPYFYNDPFNSATILDSFTNGFFESVSGFTTTGFSFIASPETLPLSLLVYRSITELMGGVGIVFLLLAFFQSKQGLRNLGTLIGVDDVCGSLRKTFLSVLAIYGVIILAFIGIFFALGFQNLTTTGTFVIDTLTGGFSPPGSQFQQYLAFAPKIFIIFLMLLGGLNFAVFYNIFTLKPRKAITLEFLTFFTIIAVGTIAVALLAKVEVLDSLFHVVSMSSSIGYSYIPLASFGNTALAILLVIMIIGGCAFSMSGGIRVSRIIAFGKAIEENIMGLFVREDDVSKSAKIKSENENDFNNFSASVSILLFIFTLVIFAVIFSTIGVSFQDSLFEMGSALTTNGISMGATTVTMGIGYKWLVIIAMTIGRIEMLTILIAIFPLTRKLRISKHAT